MESDILEVHVQYVHFCPIDTATFSPWGISRVKMWLCQRGILQKPRPIRRGELPLAADCQRQSTLRRGDPGSRRGTAGLCSSLLGDEWGLWWFYGRKNGIS